MANENSIYILNDWTQSIGEKIQLHNLWLENKRNGVKRLDIEGATFPDRDDLVVDFSNADFSFANLKNVCFSGINLSGANFSEADLYEVDFTNANLSNACLRKSNANKADFRGADLSHIDFVDTNLLDARFDGAKGILSPIDWLENNSQRHDDGYILYKSFPCECMDNDEYAHGWNKEQNFIIKKNSILSSNVNYMRTSLGGDGVELFTLEWIRDDCNRGRIETIHYSDQFSHDYDYHWACLIRWKWLSGVVVPYNTGGMIRVEKAQLLYPIDKYTGKEITNPCALD